MKKLCAMSAAVAILAALTVSAQAGHHKTCCAPACETPCPPEAPKTVTKKYLRIEEVPTELTVTEEVKVPREVVTLHKTCVMVSTCVTDPCTGCTKTVCVPQEQIHEERCTVTEIKEQKKKIQVTLVKLVPFEAEVPAPPPPPKPCPPAPCGCH